MFDHLRAAADFAVAVWERLSPRGKRNLLATIGGIAGYFVVAALVGSVVAPPPSPSLGDLPHAGMTMSQPDIKSTFVLRRTSADTGGAFVELDLLMEAGGGPGHLGSHVHPDVDERLEVLEGTAVIRVRGKDYAVTAGNFVEVPRGTSHSVRNASERFVLVRGRFTPAADMDAYYLQIDRAGGFAGAGAVRRAVLSARFRQEYPGWLPIWMSKAGLLFITPTARLVGVRVYYPPVS